MIGRKKILDSLTLDEFLINNREATYLVKVSSEDLKDEGILSGDLLLVERGREPKKGDLALVIKDGEYEILRISKSNRYQFEVEAIITTVIRKY